VRLVPTVAVLEESQFVAHPLVPEANALSGIAVHPFLDVSGDASPLRGHEVGLHPGGRVNQLGVLALAGANALHEDQPQARWSGDLSGPAAVTPGRRAQLGRLGTMQLLEHLQQQVPPGEERFAPSHVVGVHNC